MVDPELLELCRDCLIGTVLDAASDEDLRLAAIALSRDLADAQRAEARELLVAAAREAVVVLDASDIDAHGFAEALSRLAWLEARVTQALPAATPVAL
jgi:hypothetical protein